MTPQSSSVDPMDGMGRQPLEQQTDALLASARLGDAHAFGRLIARYLPRLRRWAHGRLPRWARTLGDTSDLVQDAVLHTVGRLDAFELRGRDALAAYLREAVRNRIRDEHRKIARRGATLPLPDRVADPGASPFDRADAREREARYLAALDRLAPSDRELIVAHVELEYSHAQLGCMTGRSPNAARMALQRAVDRLAAQLGEG